MKDKLKKYRDKYPSVKFEFMDTFRNAAVCYPEIKLIRISKPVFEHNSEAVMR
ncbi:hypothetical protein KY320_01475 [Candidatus Woesearchaeota archaeon]|nr:hypothetical protein [Candidatus Woesearchaeota archaeon]